MGCKWMDNWSVLLLSSVLEGMNDILSVQRREKGSKIKSLVPCPKVVKLYNSSIGGVDLMVQRIATPQKIYRLFYRFFCYLQNVDFEGSHKNGFESLCSEYHHYRSDYLLFSIQQSWVT